MSRAGTRSECSHRHGTRSLRGSRDCSHRRRRVRGLGPGTAGVAARRGSGASRRGSLRRLRSRPPPWWPPSRATAARGALHRRAPPRTSGCLSARRAGPRERAHRCQKVLTRRKWKRGGQHTCGVQRDECWVASDAEREQRRAASGSRDARLWALRKRTRRETGEERILKLIPFLSAGASGRAAEKPRAHPDVHAEARGERLDAEEKLLLPCCGRCARCHAARAVHSDAQLLLLRAAGEEARVQREGDGPSRRGDDAQSAVAVELRQRASRTKERSEGDRDVRPGARQRDCTCGGRAREQRGNSRVFKSENLLRSAQRGARVKGERWQAGNEANERARSAVDGHGCD